MKSLSTIVDNYIKGKPTFGAIRRILDLIFSIGIASFLFQRFYFTYRLLDITDYKGIFDFFVRGIFFIPLIIFLLVHYGLYAFSSIFFTLSTNRRTNKWVGDLLQIKFSEEDLADTSKRIQVHPIANKFIGFTPSWITDVYVVLKENIAKEQWNKAETVVRKTSANIEKNFILNVKAVVAVSVYYFFTVSYFGTLLYVVCIILFVAAIVFFWYSFVVLEVLPKVVRKIDLEMQEFIKNKTTEACNN